MLCLHAQGIATSSERTIQNSPADTRAVYCSLLRSRSVKVIQPRDLGRRSTHNAAARHFLSVGCCTGCYCAALGVLFAGDAARCCQQLCWLCSSRGGNRDRISLVWGHARWSLLQWHWRASLLCHPCPCSHFDVARCCAVAC